MFVNARMYSVTPAARAAWQEILTWVATRAGSPAPGVAKFVDDDPPQLLSDLWQREDLDAVMMCGLPFTRRAPQPTMLAAPVPSPARYQGQAVYMSDIVVRADAPYEVLADTFGCVAGYTLKDSQSGYYAFRHLLATKYGNVPGSYRRIVGELGNTRGMINALIAGQIDVGPIDAYAYDLIRAAEPDFAAQIRVIETTEPTPMPPIVATSTLPHDAVERLRAAFLAVESERSLASALAAVKVARFVVPAPARYRMLGERAEWVDRVAVPWD
ncbi:MAG: PhnD/SsuA/transferrin family substrate-binding protein [Burkholderiales bacterium]